MSDEPINGGPEDIDTGDPIRLLAELEEPTSTRFMAALHRRIQRRMLASDVTRLSWNGPVLIVIEFLNMVFGLLGGSQPEGSTQPERGEQDGND